MTILSIIVTITLSVLLKVNNTQNDLNNKYRLIETADRIKKELEDNLRFSSRIISGASNRIAFFNNNHESIEYVFIDDTLYKNEQPVSGGPLDSFVIFYHINDVFGPAVSFQDVQTLDYFPTNTEMNIVGVDILIVVKDPTPKGNGVRIKRRFYVRLRSHRDY